MLLNRGIVYWLVLGLLTWFVLYFVPGIDWVQEIVVSLVVLIIPNTVAYLWDVFVAVPEAIYIEQATELSNYKTKRLNLDVMIVGAVWEQVEDPKEAAILVRVWNSSHKAIVDLEVRYDLLEVNRLVKYDNGTTVLKRSVYQDEFEDAIAWYENNGSAQVSINPTKYREAILVRIETEKARAIIESLRYLNPEDFQIETISIARLQFMGRYDGNPEFHFFEKWFYLYLNPSRIKKAKEFSAPELALDFAGDVESLVLLEHNGANPELINAAIDRIQNYYQVKRGTL